MNVTKEKPINFNGEMVRAILEGRKTQTRRVVKPQPTLFNGRCGGDWAGKPIDDQGKIVEGPYQIGQRLWVRETYCEYTDDYYIGSGVGWCEKISYKADGEYIKVNSMGVYGTNKYKPEYWTPLTQMIRPDSRITLKVTNVSLERVQDICEVDAKKEGVRPIDFGYGDCFAMGFHKLWDSIYEKKCFGRDKNPWVWVIDFKVVE